MIVTLYTTLGCHLCEEATALLKRLQREGRFFSIREIDIADCEKLVERYGVRIPVIGTDRSESEISWPFTQEELERFLFSPE